MVPSDNGFVLEPVFEMSLLLARRSQAANKRQLAKSVKPLYLWRPIKLSPLYSVISFVSFITHKFSHSIQRNGFWGLNCVSIWFYHCLKWGQSGPQCGHHIYPFCIELQIYFWEWRLIGANRLHRFVMVPALDNHLIALTTVTDQFPGQVSIMSNLLHENS